MSAAGRLYGLATPLSFEVHQLSSGPSAIVYDARGMAIDTHLFEEQAADIVRAVNAHDELLAALKIARRTIDTYVPWLHGQYIVHPLKVIDEAIAKAEGRS